MLGLGQYKIDVEYNTARAGLYLSVSRVYPRVLVKLKITALDAKTKDLVLVQNNT